MKKKSSKDLGASAKKPSRSPLVSPRKTSEDTRFDGSREENAKAERHRLYKAMLRKSFADRSISGCFCEMLQIDFQMNPWGDGLRKIAPELHAQRTKSSGYWWGYGYWKPRRKALRAAIRASAPAIAIGKASRKAGSVAKRRTEAKRTLVKRGPKASPKPTKKTTPTLKRKP